MKVTGIIRRIDELGRIHIPKDIRRQIFGTQCAEGKPMEFFIIGDSIVLKKYEEAANNKRMIDADAWINKYRKIIADEAAPGEYKDYCMHMIHEIESEYDAQEDEK